MSLSNPEQSQNQPLHGELWSNRHANLLAAGGEAGVVKPDHARYASASPEDFLKMLTEEGTVHAEVAPPVEHVGEMATEQLVAHQ